MKIPAPPVAAIDAASRAATLGQGSTEPLSVAGVTVCSALTGSVPMVPEHVAAMANHPYEPDSLNGLLFGGADGKAWATEILAAAKGPNLARFSDRLADIDRLFRDRVETILAASMRAALRKADVKVMVRSSNRKVAAGAIADHRDDLARRRYTPQILAAIHTTTDELLDASFHDAAEQIGLQFQLRQRKRRRLLEREFDVDDLESEWRGEETRRVDAIAAFITAALFAEAAARLAQPRDAQIADPRGEQPVDPYLSPRIATDTIRLADGAALVQGSNDQSPRARSELPVPGETIQGVDVPEVPSPISGPETPVDAPDGMLFDYTDQLVSDIVQRQAPGAHVVYTWTVGDPGRPFLPHQDLAGMEATNDTFWTVFAKDPAEFPEGELAWFPGDHAFCACSFTIRWEETPDE